MWIVYVCTDKKNPSGYSSVIFVFTFASCVGPTSPGRVPAIAVPEHCSKMASPSRLFVLLIVWWQPGHVDARFFLITPVDVSPFTSHILGRLPWCLLSDFSTGLLDRAIERWEEDHCRSVPWGVLTDRPTVYHGEQVQTSTNFSLTSWQKASSPPTKICIWYLFICITILRVDVDLYRFGSRNMKYMILESRE